MANLSYAGVEFGQLPNRGTVPRPTDEPGGPRKLSLSLQFDSRAAYDDFRDLVSRVDWHVPLGSLTAEPVLQAGHGEDTLVVLSSGLGSGSTATYAHAYLVRVSADGSVGHEGRYVVKADFEIKQ